MLDLSQGFHSIRIKLELIKGLSYVGQGSTWCLG